MERYTLGGATYVPVRPATLAQDLWLMGAMKRAGVDEVVVRAGEVPEEWARRFLFDLSASGEALALLGGLLRREDELWTPEGARVNGAALGEVTGEEKETVLGILLTTLVAFFESGLVSFVRLTTSSSPAEQPVAVAP